MTLAFLVANAGLDAGHDVVMWLSADAVLVAQKGYAENVATAEAASGTDLLAQFQAKGGRFFSVRSAGTFATWTPPH